MTVEEDNLALEARVRRLEDLCEIYQLMASYGPAVDSGSTVEMVALWTEEGFYDTDLGVWNGHSELPQVVEGQMHGELLHGGSHQVSMPRVTVNGDSAVATCYMSLLLREGDSHVVRRQSANRWEFVRTEEGWRVAARFNRLLDGGTEARDLLRRAFTD